MRFALSLIAGLASVASASAQFGNLTYNFNGAPGTTTINSPSAISSPSSVSFAGVNNVPTTNMLNTSGWSNQTSLNASDYYSFSFTTSQAISIPSITFNALSQLSGPTTLQLRSSVTGFNTAGNLGIQPITVGTTTPVTFALPAASFGNIATATNVEFRLYGYNAANQGANSQFGFLSTNASDHGINVPIAAPVPEPVSILACSALGLGAFGFARRRLVKK